MPTSRSAPCLGFCGEAEAERAEAPPAIECGAFLHLLRALARPIPAADFSSMPLLFCEFFGIFDTFDCNLFVFCQIIC
ncbi:MAG: hypothetical protein ACI4AM_07110 [Muribaculaceae bacterium]